MLLSKGRYTREAADLILRRLAEGETLANIAKSPELPSLTTIYKWLNGRPAFRAGYKQARAIAAEGLASEALAAARAVTPKNASAKRVLLNELHWQAARIEPRDAGPVGDGAPEDLADRLERALRRARHRRALKESQKPDGRGA